MGHFDTSLLLEELVDNEDEDDTKSAQSNAQALTGQWIELLRDHEHDLEGNINNILSLPMIT